VRECWSDGVMKGGSRIANSITPILHYATTPMLP